MNASLCGKIIMSKKFNKTDGWTENVLLEHSKGHLMAAEKLFCIQESVIYNDTLSSAGYLSHLGIELLLKGCWVSESSYFEDLHSLAKLASKINFLKLNDEHNRIITNLDKFYEMRYPQEIGEIEEIEKRDISFNLSTEIGDADWVDTIKFLHEVQSQMPTSLSQIAQPIFMHFTNTIEEEKYLKQGKYLYKRVLNV